MEPIDLALVGCGIMGTRHMRGYAALERARPGSLRLRAVCDPRSEAAERVAAEAEKLLGYRPRACASAAEALTADAGIVAADVVTDPVSHPEVVGALLEAGIHVQVEKPLAVTAAAGQQMAAAAARACRILAVAENYRRDPMNRLLRYAIESGTIGTPYFMSEIHVSTSRRVMVTPWRHAWAQGGLALDVGVHFADMIEYLMGPVATVYAQSRKLLDLREWVTPDGESREVPVECDDFYAASLTFESGAHGFWLMHFASAGERRVERVIHGPAGTLAGPPDRSGIPVRLQRGSETLEGDALVAALPEFRLSDVETRLFGDRPGTCPLPFPEMDARIIGAETADFLDAIREGREPEVTGSGAGLRAVAVVMALLESARAGTPVRVDDGLSGGVRAAQERLG